MTRFVRAASAADAEAAAGLKADLIDLWEGTAS